MTEDRDNRSSQALRPKAPIEVFCSYSHLDEQLREELAKHLEPLQKQGLISTWHDRCISPGQDWQGEIDHHLESATLILLLVSPDFVSSYYCYDVELKRALERHQSGSAYVIPIILRPVHWQGLPFAYLQVLPKDGLPITKWPNTDDALLNVTEGILATIHALCQVPSHSGPANPRPVPEDRHVLPQEVKSNILYPTAPATSPAGETHSVPPELRYSHLFRLSSFALPYINLLGSWSAGINEFCSGDILCETAPCPYTLPPDFESIPVPPHVANEPKCRLLDYRVDPVPHNMSGRYTFVFSPICYFDYLRSGEHLDDAIPAQKDVTFRQRYAPDSYVHAYKALQLTGICGVGVYVLTRDSKIILSKHSPQVVVNPNAWGYSASGTMDWHDSVNLFGEIARECHEEIAHHLDLDSTRMYGLGIDTKKFFFQFSFFERSPLPSEEILDQASGARDFFFEMDLVKAVPFDLTEIMQALTRWPWDAVAAANLLLLCSKEFGMTEVEKAVDIGRFRGKVRAEMIAEWEERASRPGDAAVTSNRYGAERCKEESRRYVDAVMEFMRDSVTGRDVLEVGCGVGRLTEHLVSLAKKLTCLDISPTMIARNKQRLGARAERVTYLQAFAQDYKASPKHDVAVVSRVLVHNLDRDTYGRLVSALSHSADVLFIFDHTDVSFQSRVSHETLLRSEDDIIAAFPAFEVEKQKIHYDCDDRISFLKLVRRRESTTRS